MVAISSSGYRRDVRAAILRDSIYVTARLRTALSNSPRLRADWEAAEKKKKAAKKKAKKTPRKRPANYAEKQRGYSDAATRHTQDIWNSYGPAIYRGPKDPARRKRAEGSFRAFFEEYFPKAFYLKWSPYHLKAIEKIESAVRGGKMFAFAMPRGSGKTTLCHAAMMWATLCGWSPYALLIGANLAEAMKRLRNIKKSLRFNDLLFEDFPEVVAGIRHLENEATKARGQKFNGSSTEIEWTKETIVFPMFNLTDVDSLPTRIVVDGVEKPFTKAQRRAMVKRYAGFRNGLGSILDVASLEGNVRGRNFERTDGAIVRPTIVFPDDPQTRESAKSLNQCKDREQILKADVKYLAGPDRPTGVVMPCTVIYSGDLADRMLDRKLNPDYRGERSQMVDEFPDEKTKEGAEVWKLWRKYREIQLDDLERDGGESLATEFYRDRYEAMNAGFVVSWPERYNTDPEDSDLVDATWYELSAIQHAMNLYFQDVAAFWAEAQNRPGGEDQTVKHLTSTDVLNKRVRGLDRGVVPVEADLITAFIDIQGNSLWWVVVAWNRATCSGWVIDFGVNPDQGIPYYSVTALRRSMLEEFKGETFAAVLQKQLTRTVEHIAGRTWKNENDLTIPVSAIGIDSGWGTYATNVYKFCRRSDYRNIVISTKGVGVTARTRELVDPLVDTKDGVQESKLGQWRISRTTLGVPLFQYDTNFGKSKVVELWKTETGNPASLHLFGGSDQSLQIIADHATAEIPTKVTAKNRTVEEWATLPGREEHYNDGLVGAFELALRHGLRLPAQFFVKRATGPKKRTPKRPNSGRGSTCKF